MNTEKLIRLYETDKRSYGFSENTILNYASDVRQFVLWYNNEDVTQVRKADIKQYVRHLTEEYSPTTTNRKLMALKSFYSWLSDEMEICDNPTVGVKGVKTESKTRSYIPIEEMEQIIKDITDTRDLAIILTMAIAGLRVGEIAASDRGDYQEDRLLVHGKGNKERVVAVSGKLKQSLDEYIREYNVQDGSLFISKSTRDRITTNGVRYIVEQVSMRTGIKLHPHLFRHTAATYAYEGTGDIVAVRDLLGHNSVATTNVYTHALPMFTKRAIESNPLNSLS